MNSLANRLISYLLLLCISIAVIPFNDLHQHEEETHCDITNAALENNLCHISSYHANEFQNPHCEHKSHFDEENTDCEFCKFTNSHRHTYTVNKQSGIIFNLSSEALLVFEYSFPLNSLSGVIFSRGPPA